MALAPYALCSLDDVRAFRSISSGDVTLDDVSEDIINAASRVILNWCRREFAPATDGEARTFGYDGSGFLDFSPFDLRSLDTIEFADARVLDASEIQLRPKPSRDGVYSYAKVPTYAGGCDVTVTGDWGFEEVPADVKQAAVTTVAYWIARDVSAFSRVWAPDVGTVEEGSALPTGVRMMLSSYRMRRGI